MPTPLEGAPTNALVQPQNLALEANEVGSSQDAPASKRSSSSLEDFVEKFPDVLTKIARLALNHKGPKLSGQSVLTFSDIRCLSKNFYKATKDWVPPYLLMQNTPFRDCVFISWPSDFELKWHPKLAEILEVPTQSTTSSLNQKLKAQLSRIKWIATNKQRWTNSHWKNFFELAKQTPEEHAQRLHQLAEKIKGGLFPQLKALYLYTLDTGDLIKFLNVAFPVSEESSENSTQLEKLDFRTENLNDDLFNRLKILAKQFPNLRLGNGLGMHKDQAVADNQLLTRQWDTDYAFWNEKVLPEGLRNQLLHWMKAIPGSPLERQANNITGYQAPGENKPQGQLASYIRQMKRGRVSYLKTAQRKAQSVTE